MIKFCLSVLLLLGCWMLQCDASSLISRPMSDYSQEPESGTFQPDSVAVVYIANEGVLIRAGQSQVLIDALHKPYRRAYLPTPPEIEARIMGGEPPFDSIDFVLVSHVHRDHYDARTVAAYLKQQPNAVFFSSTQAIDSVLTYASQDRALAGRLIEIPYEAGVKKREMRDGVQVSAGKIAHGSERFKWVENLGHVVEIAGLTFLHVGDPGLGREDIEALIGGARIDVALLPSWFLTDEAGHEVIDQIIRPAHIVFVHVTPADVGNISGAAARHYPGSMVFSEPMTRISFPIGKTR